MAQALEGGVDARHRAVRSQPSEAEHAEHGQRLAQVAAGEHHVDDGAGDGRRQQELVGGPGDTCKGPAGSSDALLLPESFAEVTEEMANVVTKSRLDHAAEAIPKVVVGLLADGHFVLPHPSQNRLEAAVDADTEPRSEEHTSEL